MNQSLNGSVCLVKYWNHWRQWKMILNSKTLKLSLVAYTCILSYSGGRGSGDCLVICIPGYSCYKIAKVISQKQKQQNQKFYFSPLLLNIDSFLIQYILFKSFPPSTPPSYSPPPLSSGSTPFMSLIRKEKASEKTKYDKIKCNKIK